MTDCIPLPGYGPEGAAIPVIPLPRSAAPANPFAHSQAPPHTALLSAAPARVNQVQEWKGSGVLPNMELVGSKEADQLPGFYTGEWRDADPNVDSCSGPRTSSGAYGRMRGLPFRGELQPQLNVASRRFYLDGDGDYNHPVHSSALEPTHEKWTRSFRKSKPQLQRYQRLDFVGTKSQGVFPGRNKVKNASNGKRHGMTTSDGLDRTGDGQARGTYGDTSAVGVYAGRGVRARPQCASCTCARACRDEVKSIVRRCKRNLTRFHDKEFPLDTHLLECIFGENERSKSLGLPKLVRRICRLPAHDLGLLVLAKPGPLSAPLQGRRINNRYFIKALQLMADGHVAEGIDVNGEIVANVDQQAGWETRPVEDVSEDHYAYIDHDGTVRVQGESTQKRNRRERRRGKNVFDARDGSIDWDEYDAQERCDQDEELDDVYANSDYDSACDEEGDRYRYKATALRGPRDRLFGKELMRQLFVHFDMNIGVYGVRFYINGRWQYVIVDDQMPCDENGQPMYGESDDEDEIWVMILEKAWAKLHGSYQDIEESTLRRAVNASMGYALTALTGPDLGLCCAGNGSHCIYRSQKQRSRHRFRRRQSSPSRLGKYRSVPRFSTSQDDMVLIRSQAGRARFGLSDDFDPLDGMRSRSLARSNRRRRSQSQSRQRRPMSASSMGRISTRRLRSGDRLTPKATRSRPRGSFSASRLTPGQLMARSSARGGRSSEGLTPFEVFI